MGKLFVNIFSFDSRIDFQNGYVRCDLSYSRHSTLKDMLQSVDHRLFGYQEFGVMLDPICCRVNGLAVFDDVTVVSLVERFGNSLVIEPLSVRYCKKDLLIDFDLVFARYKDFFKNMRFISMQDSLELMRYLPLNFISTSYSDEEYLGDGFMLYIKWLISRYPMYEKHLIGYLCGENGIFLHVSNAACIFPENNAIDMLIESFQSEIVSIGDSSISKDIADLSLASQHTMFRDINLNNIRNDINIINNEFLQHLLDKQIA